MKVCAWVESSTSREGPAPNSKFQDVDGDESFNSIKTPEMELLRGERRAGAALGRHRPACTCDLSAAAAHVCMSTLPCTTQLTGLRLVTSHSRPRTSSLSSVDTHVRRPPSTSTVVRDVRVQGSSCRSRARPHVRRGLAALRGHIAAATADADASLARAARLPALRP